jgi:nucleotide-binding universal stress UspA family protein
MIAIRKVLVATDFGPASETALTYGRALARTFGGTLLVLHVVEDVYAQLMMGGSEIGNAAADIQRDLEAGTRKKLEAWIGEDDRRELGAQTLIRSGSSAALEIATFARETGVDVIVLGTHGRGPMAHLLMGSVAEKVVRTAPCPVLTVRHPEHEFVSPDALQRVPQTKR